MLNKTELKCSDHHGGIGFKKAVEEGFRNFGIQPGGDQSPEDNMVTEQLTEHLESLITCLFEKIF